jgi:DNA-binding transcriptional MerR regulator
MRYSAVVAAEDAVLRIGELSRRVGVSEHVLRAWETRYGLLAPLRTPGGFRLYSATDEHRVRRMQAHLAAGLSAAEAARTALAEEQRSTSAATGTDQPTRTDATALAAHATDLRVALEGLDEPAAQATLDRLLTDFTVELVLRDVVVPFLHDLGARWERGAISVAQEHFASAVIRGRLLGLARGWGQGGGPYAVLACPPDELHDQGLIVFGVVLHRAGWRIRYLGASTPLGDLERVVVETRPALVVLAGVSTERFNGLDDDLARLATQAPLALAGAGATARLAERVGAGTLGPDPVTAAMRIGEGA